MTILDPKLSPNNEEVDLNHFVTTLVHFLDAAGYKEQADLQAENKRLHDLKHVYTAMLNYFEEPHVSTALRISQKKLLVATRNIARLTVWCWPHASRPEMVYTGLYFIISYFLDETLEANHESTEGLVGDLLANKGPKNPYLQAWYDILSSMIQYYGPLGQMNLMRTILDFYQCCWTESKGAYGIVGADHYPGALRRLGTLGYACGACCFPLSLFNEEDIFTECAAISAQVEPIIALVNDLVSFYKETLSPVARHAPDENNLIRNTARASNMTIRQSFDANALNAIHSITSMRKAIEGVENERIRTVVNDFMIGYIRWQLGEPRYRMQELYGVSYCLKDGKRFRGYYDMAWEMSAADREDEVFEGRCDCCKGLV